MHSSTDYAAALLSKARDDGYVVRSLSADAGAPNWVIGFHAGETEGYCRLSIVLTICNTPSKLTA